MNLHLGHGLEEITSTLPGVLWDGLKAGARGLSKDSLTHMSADECRLSGETSAGLFAGTPIHVSSILSGHPYSMVPGF